MQEQQPLRVAIIGTGQRGDYLYGPILSHMKDDVELVSVWGRSEQSAKWLGQQLEVPWYTNLDQLIRETAPVIGIVSVNYNANGVVGLMAVEHGLNVLLETPIAHKLSEADAIIEAAKKNNVKIEVSEQFHRRPLEAIKLKLIEAGVFGKVYSSFNDFAGHGYHGASVMRSYLGFDAKPLQVVGATADYELASHWSRLSDTTGRRNETQEHGIVQFEGGQLGIFHWTSVGYDAQPLRWWRSSRFLAEKGMGVTVGVGLQVEERMSTIAPSGEGPRFIHVERRWERVDGGALIAMVAHTSDPQQPIVRWDNPFAPASSGKGPAWNDDEIGVAGCILSLVNAVRNDTQPTYGAEQARLDQEIIVALRESSVQGMSPIQLPMDPAAQTV